MVPLDLGQVNWKSSGNNLPVYVDAVEDIPDSWEELKISALTRGWKWIPAIMDDVERFTASVEEKTADVVETEGDL